MWLIIFPLSHVDHVIMWLMIFPLSHVDHVANDPLSHVDHVANDLSAESCRSCG